MPLVGIDGTRIALKSVHIEGRIDGLLASMAIRQRYHNDSGEKLEIVYTFPLAWGATPLGMSATLGDRRLEAATLDKKSAWEQYEAAIDSGDAPILVERNELGLYTANLGNIENGEELTVELRYAQLLSFEGSRLSLRIPCAIAPRFGDQRKSDGLSLHETTVESIHADYPLTIRISLPDKTAKAMIRCPSHAFDVVANKKGMDVIVEAGAMLDRDFVLTLDGLEKRSFALLAPNTNEHMMLACFHLSIPETMPAAPLYLKILVDCSGSMAGDSITQAKQALLGLLETLDDGDDICFSLFGNEVTHGMAISWRCSPVMRRHVSDIIEDAIKADRGGKELESALLSTLNNVTMPDKGSSSSCVLLLTDGLVCNTEKIIHAAQISGQRIFSIGVGNAPMEGPLREMAEKTGGSCELVSPNEDIVAAIRRLAGKMRGIRSESAYIDWGRNKPVWQSTLPPILYGGDMVPTFATFKKLPTSAPVFRWHMNNSEKRIPVESIRTDEIKRTENDTVTKLGVARRIAESVVQEEIKAFALKHQLICDDTSLFMVQHWDRVRSAGLPVLHQVPQMVAAGHGGFGSVTLTDASPEGEKEPSPHSLQPRSTIKEPQQSSIQRPTRRIGHDDCIANEIMWNIEPPSCTLSRTSSLSDLAKQGFTPLHLLRIFDKNAIKATNCLNAFGLSEYDVVLFVLNYHLRGISRRTDLLPSARLPLLLDWLRERFKNSFTLSTHAQQILQKEIEVISDVNKSRAFEFMDQEFPEISLDTWGELPWHPDVSH